MNIIFTDLFVVNYFCYFTSEQRDLRGKKLVELVPNKTKKTNLKATVGSSEEPKGRDLSTARRRDGGGGGGAVAAAAAAYRPRLGAPPPPRESANRRPPPSRTSRLPSPDPLSFLSP